MANIVFVVSGHIGHIHSTLRLANKLQQRGHTVIYIGHTAARRCVERHGHRFGLSLDVLRRDLPANAWRSPKPKSLIMRRRSNAEDTIARARAVVDLADQVMTRIKPDLLLFDPFLLLYYFPYWRWRIPAMALTPHPLADWDAKIPPISSGLIPSASSWSLVSVTMSWAKEKIVQAKNAFLDAAGAAACRRSHMLMLRALAAETGFPLGKGWKDAVTPSDLFLPELVFWPPEFDFPRGRTPREGVRYAGASVELNRVECPLDWNVVPKRERLVCCQFGTVELPSRMASRRALIDRVIRAFELLPDFALVVACGKLMPLDQFGRVPPNVMVLKEVPQIGVLRASHCHITHGGANSIKESVLLGVPMVVYPQGDDQPGNAARVVYHGVGVRGDPLRDSPAAIAANVMRVITDPIYRQNVERVKEVFLEYERRDTDVLAVESLLPDSAATSVRRAK